MDPLGRPGDRSEKLVEHGEHLVTETVVHALQMDRGAESISTPAVDGEIEGWEKLVVFWNIREVGLSEGKSHQFVSIIAWRSRNQSRHGALGIHHQAGRNAPRALRKRTKNDLMFVGPAEVVQLQEIRTALRACIWLYRLDEFLCLIREIPDCVSAGFVQSLCVFIGFSLDRERCFSAWPSLITECQLPRQVVEARAKIVDDIADYYAGPSGHRGVDFHAPDVSALLSIDLTDSGIRTRVSPKKSGHFLIERFQVLQCTSEFFDWPIKRGLHA
jgi:hypothetical protein